MVTQLCRVIRPMRAASEGVDADEPRRCLRHTECRTTWLPKSCKKCKKIGIFAPQSTQRESRAPRSR